MSRVGLVLGGGGITGAAYEIAALMAIRIATGWDPNQAEVVVGTSGGSFVAALVRSDALTLDSLVGPSDDRRAVADRIRGHVYTRNGGIPMRAWLRYGIVPGLRDPGLRLVFGSPARYGAGGVADWVAYHVGMERAKAWPDRPTALIAYHLASRRRIAFGTDAAPRVGLADAVAASSAIPLLFTPYAIGGVLYVDGGVASGTSADMVLAATEPLDLILVLAPMAADVPRPEARLYEKAFDRVGRRSLGEEMELIRGAWPNTEILVLSPSPSVQEAMRPNPMNADQAVPTFMRTLISMKRTLARPDVWDRLEDHCGTSSAWRAIP